MENIKFIKKISEYIEIAIVDKNHMRTTLKPIPVGDVIYYDLHNGNKAKLWCYFAGVDVEIINYKNGKVDTAFFPFAHYFAPVQCRPNAPLWTQHICSDGEWIFSREYPHVLPKPSDYESIGKAISEYLKLFACV